MLKFYSNFRKAKITEVVLQLHLRLIGSLRVPFQSISTSIEQQVSLKCRDPKILVDANQSGPYTRNFSNRFRIVCSSCVCKDFQLRSSKVLLKIVSIMLNQKLKNSSVYPDQVTHCLSLLSFHR